MVIGPSPEREESATGADREESATGADREGDAAVFLAKVPVPRGELGGTGGEDAPEGGPPGPGGRADVGGGRGVGRGAGRSDVRPLLLRLHFYAGVLIAPFLLVAAVTGLAYTLAPQLDALLYDDVLKVQPHGTPHTLADQVDVARKAVPGGSLVSVIPATAPTDSTRVVFAVEGLPENITRTAFVDPYRVKVLGTERTFGNWWLPARTWLDDLHRNLHLGDVGRNYSELAASWLWVEVLGGLALWLGTSRGRQRVRRVLLPRGGKAGRRRTLSWHGAVGLWASVGLLALSVTGLTWSAHAGANVAKLFDTLHGNAPALTTTVAAAGGSGGTGTSAGARGTEAAGTGTSAGVGIDAVAGTADRAGFSGVVVITPPARTGQAYTVQENTRSWPEKQDSIAVDPATGKVTDTVRFADYPLLSKLTSWGINAHMGLLFGVWNQIALALLALCLIAMILWGYRMWWLRRPTRERPDGRTPSWGRPPSLGAWRRVPGAVLAPAVVVAALLGYWMPLFGLPLLLFVLVDVAVGVVRSRRTAKAVTR